MTHEECLLKLLAVEPETKDGLIRSTGWPPQETLSALRNLRAQKRVVLSAGYRCQGARMYRLRAAA